MRSGIPPHAQPNAFASVIFLQKPNHRISKQTTAKINANKIKKIATAPVPAVSDSPARPNNKPAEDILRFRGHSLLFRVGGEVGIHDGLGGRFDGRVRQHVGVVGSEETLDLVVEDGTGAVVPESGQGMSGAAGGRWEMVRHWRAHEVHTACSRFPSTMSLRPVHEISKIVPRRLARRLLRGVIGSRCV